MLPVEYAPLTKLVSGHPAMKQPANTRIHARDGFSTYGSTTTA